jgi:hypothetical protein
MPAPGMLKGAVPQCRVHNQLEVVMRTRYLLTLLSLLGIALLTATYPGSAQRAPRAKVRALQATTDKTGEHPATAEIAGPATITCINAASETPNSQPVPSCNITAPGFKGIVKKGGTVKATGAGTVTLTCSGQGYMRCDARIDGAGV